MNISTFIARRIAFNQQRSFSRFIIRLSTVATVISVTVMIVTLSFVNGFQGVVSEKVFSFWGHVRIGYRQPGKTALAEEAPMAQNDSVVRTVRALKGVRSIHPFATKYAILKTPTEMEGTLVKGLDSSYDFARMQPYLEKGGRWLRFGDSSYSRELVVSRYTANQLHLAVGDRLLIYFVRPDGTLRPDKLTIVGIYKTGIEEYDKTYALGDIRLLRRLNGWQDNEVGGYEVFLDDYRQMDDKSLEIFNLPNFPELWETRTIREIYPNIFDWLGIVGSNGNILLLIVAVIVIINFITCLIILVLERVRMIGILKAVGASDWAIQKIFLVHSALVTLVGIAIGTGFSVALIGLQQKYGIVKLKEEEYYMNVAAVQLDWGQVALVVGCTLLLSVLVLLIPSLIVRKIRPIQAIRFS